MSEMSLAGADLPLITIGPRGLLIPGYRHPLRVAEALVHSHGAARILDIQGRTICRSFDAIESRDDRRDRCAECPRADRCTIYVRAEVILGGLPYRLFLTKVSARNFLVYIGTRPMAPDVRIRVLHRGSWGEARFEDLGPGDSP